LQICHFYADYWGIAQGLSKNESNVSDLYQNKKIEGQPVSKPDVRLNRVNKTYVKKDGSFIF